MKKILIFLALLPSVALAQVPPPSPATPQDVIDGTATYKFISPYAAAATGLGPTNATGITWTISSNLAYSVSATNSTTGNAATATVATNASNLSGSVFLVRSGTQTQYPTIEAAAAASVPFDEIKVSGTVNVSNAVPIKSNVRMNLAGAYVKNWVTQVGTNGPAFILTGTNAQLTGPGVIYNVFRNVGSNDSTGFSYQACFGVLESGLGSSRLGYGGATNFLVQNIWGIGETDVAFFRATNGAMCSGIIRDSTFDSRWDALLVAEGAHKITFQNVNINAIGTNQASGQQGRSYAATFDDADGSEITWVNSSLTASNSLSMILNAEIGGNCTNRFIGCSFTNLFAAATEDFMMDGGVGAAMYFNNCTGLRPDKVSDLFAGGGTIYYGRLVSDSIVFGGDALTGNKVTMGVGATDSVLPFTGALTGSGNGLTNIPPTTGIAGWPANSAGYLANNGSGTLSWGTPSGSGGWWVTNAAAANFWTNYSGGSNVVFGASLVFYPGPNADFYFNTESGQVSKMGGLWLDNAETYFVGDVGLATVAGDFALNNGEVNDLDVTGTLTAGAATVSGNVTTPSVLYTTNGLASGYPIDFSKSFFGLATNNTVPVGVPTGWDGDNWNQCMWGITNTGASPILISVPAWGQYLPGGGTVPYVTNYAIVLFWSTHGTGTNYMLISR